MKKTQRIVESFEDFRTNVNINLIHDFTYDDDGNFEGYYSLNDGPKNVYYDETSCPFAEEISKLMGVSEDDFLDWLDHNYGVSIYRLGRLKIAGKYGNLNSFTGDVEEVNEDPL